MGIAQIHHIDGNPLNNPPDGSNWMLLCVACHGLIPKIKRRRGSSDGISVYIKFAQWKYAEIFQMKGGICYVCGVQLQLGHTSAKPRPKCYLCGVIIDRKCDLITWKDGKIMCKQCFDDFTEGSLAK